MSDKYPEIFVLRHGETEWNRAGRYQGSLNSDLTELGQMQATTQGEILRAKGLADRDIPVFSSPQGRTRQTADIVTEVLGCTHRPDTRLVELGQAEWEGLFEHEIKAGWPDAYSKRDGGIGWYFVNKNGETYAQIQARCKSFLDGLSGPAVIVTHGVTSHILRGVWLGLDLRDTAALTGGQGCVYHLHDGQHHRLEG